MNAPFRFLITPLSRESITRFVATPLHTQPAKVTATANETPFSVISRLKITALLLALTFLTSLTAHGQNVGDFILNEKTASTGRVTPRYWPKGASKLWGTTSGSLPQSITIGTGLTLSGTTLSSSGSGGTWGSITGTLSNQTDLNTALNLKAPLASPTFTGTVTIPSGAQIEDYVKKADPYILGTLTWEHPNTELGAQMSTLSIPSEQTALSWTMPSEAGRLLTTASSLNASNLTTGTLNVARIADGAVTNAKLANSSMTIDGTVRSLGESFSAIPTGITLTSGAVSAVTITRTALGTTPTTGLNLTNTTPAAAGAQQVSPRAIFTGQGWKTTATAASQPVSFGFSVLPVQGSTAPTGTFLIESDINNAGTWPDVLSVGTDGLVSLPNGAGGVMTQVARVASGFVEISPAGTTIRLGTANSPTIAGFIYPGGLGTAGSFNSDGAGNIAMRGAYDPSLSQELSIYNVDSGANDELARLGWRAATNTLVLETVRTGTGTARPIQIRVNGTTAITISATGAISMTLPTTAGASGTLWNDGGTVKVVP